MSGQHPRKERTALTRFVDAGTVLAISTFAAFLSGSQRWTGFNSPDSEFYASLALFGNDVTDRSIDPAYTWTRLGYIAPVRLLVTTLDPWVGFALWRFILIVIVVGSIYAIVRIASTRELAVLLAAAVSLNTMILSFVGSTYLTGTILAATLLLLALGVWGCLDQPRWPWLPALLAGAMAAWLVMLNPYALLLGITMWVGLRIIPVVDGSGRRWRSLARDALLGVVGFAVVLAAFLAIGQGIFPQRNWFQTYLEWNAKLDYASFVGDRDVWQRDVALLVPVVAIVMAAVAVLTVRRSRTAAAALVASALNIAFTAGYFVLVPGPWLESPTYVAKLWPGALVGIALALAAVVGKRRLGPSGWLVGLVVLPLLLWSGRWDRTLDIAEGVAIGVAMATAFAVAAVLGRRAPGRAFAVAVVATLGITAIGAQVLQNGRGLLGSYGQFPFRAAYVDFDAETLMRSKVTAQEWLIDQTTPADAIGIWTDPDRLTSGVAAMQLWGAYNNVSGGRELSREEADRLAIARPTAIAMYAPSREQIDVFWASIPPWARATHPECTAVPFLGIGSPEAHVCVTHLSWLG